MSSTDCNTDNVTQCVRYKPNLAFGIFMNEGVFAASIWVLFLTYHGIMRFTGAEGITDFFRFLYYGVTGVFSGVLPTKESLETGVEAQFESLKSNWTGVLLYLAALVATVWVGIYFADTPIAGTLGLGILFTAFLFVWFSNTPGGLQLAAGAMLGLVIVGIYWLANFFSLEKGNEFGNMVMILLVIWIAITLFVYLGSRSAPKKKGAPKKNNTTAAKASKEIVVVNTQAGAAQPTYPLAKWLKDFKKKYNTLARANTGADATDAQFEDAWRRAVPLAKTSYNEYATVDMADIAASVYR